MRIPRGLSSLSPDSRIARRAHLLFHEHHRSIAARTDRMFAMLMITQWLAGIVIAVSSRDVRPLPVVSGASSERTRVVNIAVARPSVRLSPVVIALAVVGGATAPPIRDVSAPLDVFARVMVARI